MKYLKNCFGFAYVLFTNTFSDDESLELYGPFINILLIFIIGIVFLKECEYIILYLKVQM